MEAVQAYEELGRLRKEQFGVLKQLKDLQMPFKQSLMDRIKAWHTQFDSARHKYKFLVLRAKCRSSKL